MRKMHAAMGKKTTVEPRQIRLIPVHWILHKEEPIPMRQVMYHKARDMLRKAKLPKNGSYETILERWSADAVYQLSLSDEVWTEEKIRQYDALALEDHPYEATPAERGRWHRNWKIVLNKGVEGKIRQRPDFREAKHACRRLSKEHVESAGEGNKSMHPARQRRQNSQW